METKSASFDEIPGTIPKTAPIHPQTNKKEIARFAINKLNAWRPDALTADALWRDFVSFTGTYRTFHSRESIHEVLCHLSEVKHRSAFGLTSREPRLSGVLDETAWLDVDFDYRTREGHLTGIGSGTASLVCCEDGEWRIWMLRTWLECFEGLGHPDVLKSSSLSATPGIESIYDAVVVGGGQAGLSLAGRLQAVGVRYVLLEKNAAIGDVWKDRYDSLSWHTPKEYGELPFGRTFSADDPNLVPTKMIAARHKAWAEKYSINVKTDCEVQNAQWSDEARRWVVRTTKGTFEARTLVLSIGGGSSMPVLPSWARPDEVASSEYHGTIIHGSQYRNCKQWTGKRGVVVGTANTGHDVAEDMLRAGMQTTLLQRGSTFVLPIEWLHGAMAPHYNQTVDTERGDRESFTYPNKVFRDITNKNVHHLIDTNSARFDALEKAGFQLDRYGDLANNIYIRAGGHYIDHGASAKIAGGQIGVLNKVVRCLTSQGLRFEDGTEIETDIIVCCTGFEHNFRAQTSKLLGDAADGVGPYLGVDAEGEIRGQARPLEHPGLYIHGGDVRSARWFSRFIALRLQAEKNGGPLAVFSD